MLLGGAANTLTHCRMACFRSGYSSLFSVGNCGAASWASPVTLLLQPSPCQHVSHKEHQEGLQVIVKPHFGEVDRRAARGCHSPCCWGTSGQNKALEHLLSLLLILEQGLEASVLLCAQGNQLWVLGLVHGSEDADQFLEWQGLHDNVFSQLYKLRQ